MPYFTNILAFFYFPAIVVELKRTQSAGAALLQIKAKYYPEKIAQYTGKILLVGINYDEDKGHSCVIEGKGQLYYALHLLSPTRFMALPLFRETCEDVECSDSSIDLLKAYSIM